MGLQSYIQGKLFPNWGKEEVTDRASKGVVKDAHYSYPSLKQGNPADENLNVILDVFQKDPVVNTAVTKWVNLILSSGYSIEGSKTGKNQGNSKLKKAKFNYAFLKQFFLNAKLYRHIFVEMSDTEGGLHILETPQMEILHDVHGTITGYEQRAVTGDVITWEADEILYIPFDKVTTSVWGEVELKSLYKTIATKNFIENLINSLSATHAWRPLMETTMSDDDLESFLPYLRELQADPTFPAVFQKPSNTTGEATNFTMMRDPAELNNYIAMLSYLRGQILMQLKIPPIYAGIPDNSNRSSSDDQMKGLFLDIAPDKQLASDAFNDVLFPYLKIVGEFSWNPADKRSEKDDVEIAEKLMNMGAKPDQIEAFLRNAGLDLPEGKLFDPKPDPMEMASMKTPDESRPSRQRTGDDVQEKIGTGKDSSTRADQMGG